MHLSFFTDEAYNKLYNEVDDNLDRYKSGESWVNDFFEGREYFKKSNVNVGAFDLQINDEYVDDKAKNEEDLINARMVYDALKGLTPLQASNQYMWAYLCHMWPNCSKYIVKRWNINEPQKIQQRFFVPKDANGLYYFNALSRLWWAAYFTYDKDHSKPYHLTEILFSSQIFCKDVLDTLNRRNPERIKGVLLGVKQYKDEGKKISTNHFRECKKILNRKAAIKLFDAMSHQEIQKITYDTLVRTEKNKYSSEDEEMI